MYICPVCGFEKMDGPPADFNICPCCGTEFGYDDFEKSYQDLSYRWIASGCPWFSPLEGPPPAWNAKRQLLNVQYAQKTIAEGRTGLSSYRAPAAA